MSRECKLTLSPPQRIRNQYIVDYISSKSWTAAKREDGSDGWRWSFDPDRTAKSDFLGSVRLGSPENVKKLACRVGVREQQIGGSRGSLEPPGPLLDPPGPLLTHLHTVFMAYSECLPTRLNPLAERTCFSQVGVVYGDDSAIVNPATQRLMAKDLGEHVPLVGVADAEHHLFLDQPLAFVAVLRSMIGEWKRGSTTLADGVTVLPPLAGRPSHSDFTEEDMVKLKEGMFSLAPPSLAKKSRAFAQAVKYNACRIRKYRD
jgi:hypothetical protein